MNNENVLDFVSHWAREMIAAGANTERVSIGVTHLFHKFGYKEISIDLLTTKVELSIRTKEGVYLDRHLAVPTAKINLERIRRLNRLSYKVVDEDIDDKDLASLLEEATNSKTYPRVINCLALTVAMVALSRIFGGLWQDIVVVILNTLVLFGLTTLTGKANFNRIISNVLCMFVCTASAALFHNIGFAKNFFVIILTNAFYLVPGIQLVNAFRNIFCGQEMNGIIELLKGLLELITIIAGVAFGYFCFCQDSGLLIEGAIPTHSGVGLIGYEIELVVLSIFASLGFAVSFEVRKKRDLFFAALGGGIIRVAFILLIYAMPNYRIAYMTLAAFVAALYAEILANIQKKSSIVYLYPSIIPLIPGDLVLYTCFGMVWQNPELFGPNGMESILALVGICTGFVLCSTIMHYVRRFKSMKLFKRNKAE